MAERNADAETDPNDDVCRVIATILAPEAVETLRAKLPVLVHFLHRLGLDAAMATDRKNERDRMQRVAREAKWLSEAISDPFVYALLSGADPIHGSDTGSTGAITLLNDGHLAAALKAIAGRAEKVVASLPVGKSGPKTVQRMRRGLPSDTLSGRHAVALAVIIAWEHYQRVPFPRTASGPSLAASSLAELARVPELAGSNGSWATTFLRAAHIRDQAQTDAAGALVNSRWIREIERFITT